MNDMPPSPTRHPDAYTATDLRNETRTHIQEAQARIEMLTEQSTHMQNEVATLEQFVANSLVAIGEGPEAIPTNSRYSYGAKP